MPAPAVSGAILAWRDGQLVEVGLDRRPDVDPDVVHVEPSTRCAARGAGPTDGLEAVGDGALRVGQRGDPTALVADHDELAHLGQRHEALVGLVAGGGAEVEQHVLGSLEPGDLEVAQPPEVEPPTDHRVHAAHQPVLDHRPVPVRAGR